MNEASLKKFAMIGSETDPYVSSIKQTGNELKNTVISGIEKFSLEMAKNAALPDNSRLALVNTASDSEGSLPG